ncbi:MAG: murein biosynthesis integral membrane protein MurJ [Hyphomicrobiaceae bacterium]|nr:murein biosynthesis integral membrane protein MurJ [Hyphomicrobiaceae bacterium]
MKLFKSFATVGVFTLMSRVLGFVRDIMIAAVLGTGPVAEAFVVAFRFPNLFRRLFAEGAFNSAFIPLFAKRLEGEGRAQAKLFAEQSMAVLIFALIVVTALAEIFMPFLMLGMAGGFSDTPEKFDLAVLLTRITMPYLLFVSLLALFSGILNAFHKFAAAAAAPVILNLVFIAALAGMAVINLGNTEQAGVVLAWAVSIGGLLQLLAVMVAAKKIGMALKLRLPRLTPGVKRLLKLGIPGVIAGGVVQINIVIGTLIASMQDQAVAWLYYADRLYQLPLGVVGIAIGVVLLPDISRLLRAGKDEAAHDSQNRSMEFSLLLTLPAAVALAVVPQPLIQVLFERGHFGAHDTQMVGMALMAFAFGLPAFVLIKVFQPGFFAREDTKTPMVFATISIAVNIVVSLALFPYMGHIGIAIATTAAGWINAGLLWVTLSRRGHYALDAKARKAIPRILFASLLMGGALYAGLPVLAPWLDRAQPFLVQAGALGALVMAGVFIYFFIAALIGAFRVGALKSKLRRRG